MSSNGSNPRLDRIEKIIEENARSIKEFERANKDAHARHEREMAEIREIGRKTRDELRGWTALGVREARNQRKRQREIDENISRLSAAQLITEEKLQQFISSIGRRPEWGLRR